LKRIAIRYAAGIFIFTVIWTLLEHVAGFNTTNHAVGQYTRGVTAFLYYGTVALAIWKLRKQQDNSLTFAQGMKTGCLTAGIYSVLVTLWFALYAEVINTQYKPTLMAYERRKLQAANFSHENVEAKMKQLDMMTGGTVVSYLMLFGFMALFGVIVSLIASFAMKRRRRYV
jgi:hypothetical protein